MQIFTQETIQDNSVITLEIQSLDTSNSRRVSERLEAAMRGEGQIVVDLGALRYFDVNGFAAILQWAAGKEGMEVKLCSGCGTIQALFELLSANTLVRLFQNREEAMASFGPPGGRPQGRRDTETLAPLEENVLSGRRVMLEP